MKIIDHLLACLSEECAEVQKVACKALRFGITDMNPHNGSTNKELIREEMHDVIAVYEMICEEIGMDSKISSEQIDIKKQKVIKYMKYAKETGQLKGQ